MGARAWHFRSRAVAVALVLVAFLEGCGGGDAAGPSTPASAEAPTSTATPPPPPATPPPWPVAAVLPERARARITTDNLNVRVGPATTTAAVGLLEPGDEVAIAGRSPDSQWLAIAKTGWIVYRAEWMQLNVELRTLPEVGARELVPPAHPPGTSSGYPAVDVVIEAALAQDVARLVRLAETLSTPCSTTSGSGGPPDCNLRPGTAERTPLEVFPTAVCEGEHVLAENLGAYLARLYESGGAKNAPLRLYAVIEGPRQQSPFFPDGRWIAILSLPDGTGRALGISERGLVRADLGCNAPATEMLMRRAFEAPVFVLTPVLTPPVRARP